MTLVEDLNTGHCCGNSRCSRAPENDRQRRASAVPGSRVPGFRVAAPDL